MIARHFLRALSVIYLIAFWSLGVQILGLIGSQGILPVDQYLHNAKEYWGTQAFYQLPTMCWLNHSDAFLLFLCVAGGTLSVILFFGVCPGVSALFLWIIYLSLVSAGQDFLGFQWDNLLLEAGFLAIFLFPLRWKINLEKDTPSRIIIWLLRLLLFKLMFQSGLVKLLSHDKSWLNITALTYHFWTQPLPNIISWYADKLPIWFLKFSCLLMLFIEIGVPWMIFMGQRLRTVACYVLMGLQLLILLTGNYCFFNLLTIALCLILLEDNYQHRPISKRHQMVAIGVALIVVLINVIQIGIQARVKWPAPVMRLTEIVYPFRTINNYGLFAVMTTQRNEIVIEGSDDGESWKTYEFNWKPGDLSVAPKWVAPYQPRLDWQMWFAALSDYRQNPWILNTMVKLMQGSKSVLALFKENPFKEHPPKFTRALFYEYHFTNFNEYQETHDWWKRSYKGEYVPSISLAPTP